MTTTKTFFVKWPATLFEYGTRNQTPMLCSVKVEAVDHEQAQLKFDRLLSRLMQEAEVEPAPPGSTTP